jgi:hypothetical protein
VATTSSPPAAPRHADRREQVIAAVLLGLVAVLFVVSAWPRITAPFGDSDEGINGAVWGSNSRGLRELGPLDSRLGGVRVDHTKYATHPPLIIAETALIEQLAGEHPWSTRAPAWLGSLAAIVVMYLLIRSLGLARVPAAAATAAAMTTFMLFVYGAMLDTMITAFPFALAVALVWHRQWTGAATPRWWLVLAIATVACLGGWQATFLVGLCALSTAARFRSQPGAIARALPYAGAVILGVGLTLSWAYWVYGSFDVLNDKLLRRTGGTEPVSLGDMVSFQVPWLTQLLGVGFLAWIACAVSLRDRRFRPLAGLSLASVILYAVFLKEGSGGHQYWNFWGLFPAAIGLAYVFDAIAAALGSARRRPSPWPTVVPLLVAAVLVGVNLTQPNQAAELIDRGYAPYRLIDATPLARDQIDIPYIAEPYRIDDWLRYRGGPQGRPLLNAGELHELARTHPDFKVFVLGSCASPDPTAICEAVTFHGLGALRPDSVAPRFETAASLDRLLE